MQPSNKFQSLSKKLFSFKMLFIFSGIASTIWFLVRVIPKPSRATYPCMRAAAPVISSFIIYLLGVTSSMYGVKLIRKLTGWKVLVGAAVLSFGMFVLIVRNPEAASADITLISAADIIPNMPVGTATGAIPGRVVWVWDPEATDGTLTNNSDGNYWYQKTDQDVVDQMFEDGLLKLAGVEDVNAAWDTLFAFFNRAHGYGNVSYLPGEKIVIKINLTTSCCSVDGTNKTQWFDRMDTSPQVMLALLRQLINVVGVAEEDITLGDPYRRFSNIPWDYLTVEFPDVNYIDDLGIDGRVATQRSVAHELYFSDGQFSTTLPQCYLDAAYMINVPALKAHDAAGVTFAAKNHQGSIIEDDKTNSQQSAMFMHYSFPTLDPGPKKFRHLVDYMGNRYLGGNTLLILVDGLWSSGNWSAELLRWQMPPFNNDYPNSLILAQDPVALESVCYDFFLEEFKNKPSSIKYPYFDGTGDYILQAASSDYWPDDFEYDPENDGSPIGSLGVAEHWNNGTDKQYSVNLGLENGIELVSVPDTLVRYTSPSEVKSYKALHELDARLSPNPSWKDVRLNLNLDRPSDINVKIYNTPGQLVYSLSRHDLAIGNQSIPIRHNLSQGIYLMKILGVSDAGRQTRELKLVVTR